MPAPTPLQYIAHCSRTKACFGYNWLAKRPTLEQLKEAHKNGEEIKKRYLAKRRKAAAV
jgi:hypothetical protein